MYVYGYQHVTEIVFVYPSPPFFTEKTRKVSAFSWFSAEVRGFPGKRLLGPFTEIIRCPFDNINVINKI